MLAGGREWWKCEGASTEAIRTLQATSDVPFPAEYIEFLLFSDGGEGPLAVSPFNCCLDPAETVTRNLRERTFDDSFAGFLVIGGNGAGELLAFDGRQGKPWPVVAIDMCNCNLDESVVPVADSFAQFLDYLGLEAT